MAFLTFQFEEIPVVVDDRRYWATGNLSIEYTANRDGIDDWSVADDAVTLTLLDKDGDETSDEFDVYDPVIQSIIAHCTESILSDCRDAEDDTYDDAMISRAEADRYDKRSMWRD